MGQYETNKLCDAESGATVLWWQIREKRKKTLHRFTQNAFIIKLYAELHLIFLQIILGKPQGRAS